MKLPEKLKDKQPKLDAIERRSNMRHYKPSTAEEWHEAIWMIIQSNWEYDCVYLLKILGDVLLEHQHQRIELNLSKPCGTTIQLLNNLDEFFGKDSMEKFWYFNGRSK